MNNCYKLNLLSKIRHRINKLFLSLFIVVIASSCGGGLLNKVPFIGADEPEKEEKDVTQTPVQQPEGITAIEPSDKTLVNVAESNIGKAGDDNEVNNFTERSLVQNPKRIENENPVTQTSSVRKNEWVAIAKRGDKAAKAGKWEKAANLYNQALDLINNPIYTPRAPTRAKIKKIIRLASQMQLLAENLREPGTRSALDCNTMIRSKVRGIKIVKHIIPIQFEFVEAIISETGEKLASKLAYCLQNAKGFKKVTRTDGFNHLILIVHTDDKGCDKCNYNLSVARAEALKEYLESDGLMINITTEGKGEKEPLQLDNSYNYSSDEIDILNQRVEVITQLIIEKEEEAEGESEEKIEGESE